MLYTFRISMQALKHFAKQLFCNRKFTDLLIDTDRSSIERTIVFYQCILLPYTSPSLCPGISATRGHG
jgi:hypothetical protein